jgi:phosphoserine phosphatase
MRDPDDHVRDPAVTDERSVDLPVIFDICNTLFDSNTTFDFLRYCVGQRLFSTKRRYVYHAALNRLSPGFWTIAALQVILRADLHKKIGAFLLRGLRAEMVERWAAMFYKDYLSTRQIEVSFGLLNRYARSNVLLASATFKPVGAAIATELRVTGCVCTELEIVSGVYTGHISREVCGHKLRAIAELLCDPGIRFEAVVSDNRSDLCLMLRSKDSYALCHNANQVQFWSAVSGVQVVRPGQGKIRETSNLHRSRHLLSKYPAK